MNLSPDFQNTPHHVCEIYIEGLSDSKERLLKIAVSTEESDSICQSLIQGVPFVSPSYQLLFDLITPESTVLDLGAHVGTFTLIASVIAKRVISVEGSAKNARLLNASRELNAFTNLQLVHAAVSNKVGTVYFREFGPYGSIENENSDGTYTEVLALPVDDLLRTLLVDKIDVLKMDIEGAEIIGLEGMKNLLSSPNAPLISFESNGFTLGRNNQTTQQLIQKVSDFGYQLYSPRGNILHPIAPTDFQSVCVADYLAVKPQHMPLKGWTVGPALSVEQLLSDLLAEGYSDNIQLREYTAKVLEITPNTVKEHPEIKKLLATLSNDAVPCVRDAVQWNVTRR